MNDPLPPQTILLYIGRLTPRQLEIIEHIADGKTNKEISHLLSISKRTVINHVFAARKRLNVETRMELVTVFIAWKYSSKQATAL